MTNEREASCNERIATHMASRADDVRKMLAVRDGETKVCRTCGRSIIENTAMALDEGAWLDSETLTGTCDGYDVNGLRHPLSNPDDGPHAPDDEYTEDSLYEFGLGISRKVLLRFDISTGGPADWLEILCEEMVQGAHGERPGDVVGLDVERVTYHFADWFDHAEQVIEEGSPLYELAEWVAETQGGQ